MDPPLPLAPQIDGEAMLEIFVHSSIRFPGAPMNADSPYSDGQRLSTIGHRMLEAAYTSALFEKRPMLDADALEVCLSTCSLWLITLMGSKAAVNNLDSDVEKWVEGYKWREKVRHGRDVDLNSPKVRPNFQPYERMSHSPIGDAVPHGRLRRRGLRRKRLQHGPELDNVPC